MVAMSRWEPGARERIVKAAVDLFTEQGYDETTVAQIADRAGITRSTFFRYFPDKRDVLAAGQETLSGLLVQGISQAPPGVGALDAVASGLRLVSTAMGPTSREMAPRLEAAVAANAELQERQALKIVGLAAAMTSALVERGFSEATAQVAAELGVLAFKRGFADWSAADADEDADLARYALDALDELRGAATNLG